MTQPLPLVLHHGVCGTPGLRLGPWRVNYFRGIDRALAGPVVDGKPTRDVIVPRVHPTAGIAYRAEQLKQQIISRLDQLGRPDDPVVIVGHSMGGLDARYMVSKLGMASRVAAILTVTTPHRGSPVADFIVRNFYKRIPVLRMFEGVGMNLQAGRDLTTDHCRRFNDEVPDAEGVKYFSIGAARPWHLVPAFAIPGHQIIQKEEGDNDGLVSLTSSAWGERLGTWPADHWHTINRRLVVEIRNPTGCIIPYYERAVARVDAAVGA